MFYWWGASQCSPFLTLPGSPLHFMATQFVAQTSEFVQLNFYGLTACFMKRQEEEDVRQRGRERNREGEVEGIFCCSLTRSSNCPFKHGEGIYGMEMKYVKWVKMCKRERYTFNRTFHITMHQWKNGCANSIITLFQLIKCMIIPWREIRGGNTAEGIRRRKPDEAFVSDWAAMRGAALCPLEDISNTVDVEKIIRQKWLNCNPLSFKSWGCWQHWCRTCLLLYSDALGLILLMF